jgi:hypothetical protein
VSEKREPPPKTEPVAQPWADDLADEPKTNPRIRRSNHFTRLISLGIAGGFSVGTLAVVAVTSRALAADAKDAGASAARVELAPVIEKVNRHDEQLKSLEAATRRLEADLYERGLESRDLYKAVVDGKRSQRLETPLPPLDGGTK